MNPEIAGFTIEMLLKIITAAPGFLATFSGHEDDETALEAARVALDAIPGAPARTGINRRKAELAFQMSHVELVRTISHDISTAQLEQRNFVAIPVEGGEALLPISDAIAHLNHLRRNAPTRRDP